MARSLDEFGRIRGEAATLAGTLAGVADGIGSGDVAEPVRALATRIRDGRFVVLLIGCFSSGKSTLLNALLGQPALPVKVNPCTAILTEVVHGPKAAVTVRFRDGRTDELDVPAFLDRYQLRTADETEAGAEATDRFGDIDRAVLAYPLPWLQAGVVLLDTPGLDDDDVRTARTMSSLPDADAVVMVLNATRFLTDLERRTLHRTLRPLGLTNLFFPVTMVDLLDSLSDQPEADLAELWRRGEEGLSGLCVQDGANRFKDRFFPVDARGGLAARWDRQAAAPRDPADPLRWQATGMAPFEASLERFLVEERGQAQLLQLLRQAERARAELGRRRDLDAATADATLEDLQARHTALRPRLDQLDVIARRVETTTQGFVDRQKALLFQDFRDFLARTEEALPEAVAGFDLGGLATLDLITPNGRARVESRMKLALEEWLDQQVLAWQESLKPRLERSLHDLRAEIAAEASDFDRVADEVLAGFAGSGRFSVRTPVDGANRAAPDAAERWLSVALGAAMLSPGAMAAGWVQGYEGALKGAASRLGVRIAVLTLGALLGPVGWVGILLYVVSDAVLLFLTGGGQLRRLRRQVADGLQGKLVGHADSARSVIESQVADGLRPLQEGLVAAAHGEAQGIREALDRLVAERVTAQTDAAARSVAWAEALVAADAALEELRALVLSP